MDGANDAVLVTIPATAAWRGWLGRLADHCDSPRAAVVSEAVADLALRRGFEERPPARRKGRARASG